MKRAIDIVMGAVLACAATPVVFLLAIGCLCSLRTWPFFVQRRAGKDGRLFALPKLRTLPRSAPSAASKYELAGTRIPAFCRLLRRTHLDELPQLFVVPLGWMSLVGPRPEMPTLLASYPTEFVAARTRVRPGCTGLWQLSVAAGGLIYEAPEFDVFYVENAGIALDAWIVWRTARMWITGRSALDLADVPRWALKRRAVPLPVVTIDLNEPDWDLAAKHELEDTRDEVLEVAPGEVVEADD